jgi:hypothetical protein
MRNLIGVADGVKLSESAPFGLALGQSGIFFRKFLRKISRYLQSVAKSLSASLV